MTIEKLYQQEKAATWAIIENLLGDLHAPGKSKDWRVTKDERISVFVTYSKLTSKVYWYDFASKDLANWLMYEDAYIILVVGSRDNLFVIPVDDLAQAVINAKATLATDGAYKFHIKEEQGKYTVVQAPNFPLNKYRNNLAPFGDSHPGNAPSGSGTKTIYIAEEPEEVEPDRTYREGSTKKITVNVYERDNKARAVCIRAHGTVCKVCDFDFGKTYGEHGKGFIHVHHLKPLSEIGEEYELDPIRDLRPVCPNCHAMIHRKNKLYSIEEIKDMVDKHRQPMQSH